MWGNHQWATAMWGADLAAIFAMAPACRLMGVDAEGRQLSALAETRSGAVSREWRRRDVAAEGRRGRVTRETRINKLKGCE
jgi:hypothetical protein